MDRAPFKVRADAIREALRSTDHEVPAQDVLERSAVYANGWRSLDEAISSASSAPAAGFRVEPEILSCLLTYREGLAEAGRPDMTAMRLRWEAEWAQERASRHLSHAAEYARAAARYLARESLIFAAQQAGSASAAMTAASRELDRAARLNARAQVLALVVKSAA